VNTRIVRSTARQSLNCSVEFGITILTEKRLIRGSNRCWNQREQKRTVNDAGRSSFKTTDKHHAPRINIPDAEVKKLSRAGTSDKESQGEGSGDPVELFD
jgi:hypothetical protein